MEYQFTKDWFSNFASSNWETFIKIRNPLTVLEVGSFEGRSACFFIDNSNLTEIHCIDPWMPYEELIRNGVDFKQSEQFFDSNIKIAIGNANRRIRFYKHKCSSEGGLMKLFLEGRRESFDFIYIDGSHLGKDVLSDAVLAFKLLKPEGYMLFDDYKWGHDIPENCPKIGIDAFLDVYKNETQIIFQNWQLCIKKIDIN